MIDWQILAGFSKFIGVNTCIIQIYFVSLQSYFNTVKAMEKNNLNWKNVPEGWALCFNSECPLHESCLRWQAGKRAPQEVTVARCITPRALTGDWCVHFASMEPQTYAYGFSTIYQRVLKNDFTPLRKQMTEHLQGKRYYYEYLRGERPLSPEQQQWIRRLFERYGYGDSVVFDRLQEAYNFPWA